MGQITILVNYKAKHETREIFVNEVIESEILDKIKKEDGSLFEKIIAECIGGIAETVLDFTTRRKSKCRI